jgi:hypothetical protein
MTYEEIATSPAWAGCDVYDQPDDGDQQAACFEVEHGGRSLFVQPTGTFPFVVARQGDERRFPDARTLNAPAWARWLRDGGAMPEGDYLQLDEVKP